MTPDVTAQAMEKRIDTMLNTNCHNWYELNYLRTENQKLHQDHARLVAGMEKIAKKKAKLPSMEQAAKRMMKENRGFVNGIAAGAISENHDMRDIAEQALSSLHFPPSA